MRKIFLEGKYLVCRVEEQQRRKGKKIFHDGKWAVCGEEGKGGKYLEMENLSSECCKTLKFSMLVAIFMRKWPADAHTCTLTGISGRKRRRWALLIYLQLFGASVLSIYQHHLKVQCRFVLRDVSIYQFCSHLFGIFFKNPLTPSVPQPGTPKSNYESNLRTTPLLREKMFKIFIQLGRETVVAKCLILYVTQTSIPDASWFASSAALSFEALCSSSSCSKYQK